MSNNTYDVLYQGDLVAGSNREEVIQSFAQLFKIDAEKAANIIAGKDMRLKKDLDLEQANKYQAVLKKVGMLVDVVAHGTSAPVGGGSANPPAAGKVAELSLEDNSPKILPFIFTGSGGEYFKIWIVNILLTIVTVGIYAPWAKVRNKRYFYGNINLDGASFEYDANPVKILIGRVIALVIFLIYIYVQSVDPSIAIGFFILFMIAFPWILVRSMSFNARYSSYRNVRFGFDGTYGGAVAAFIGWPILSLFTVWILLPFAIWKQKRFLIEGHRYGNSPWEFTATVGSMYKFCLTVFFVGLLGFGLIFGAMFSIIGFDALSGIGGAEPTPEMLPIMLGLQILGALFYLFIIAYTMVKMANLVYGNINIAGHQLNANLKVGAFAWLLFTNTLGLVFTLGLFYPWAAVRSTRYYAQNMSLTAQSELSGFASKQEHEVSALGEQMGDIFDVEVGL